MNKDINRLIELFENSNLSFLKKDKSLLFADVSERSWYSRFSIYMSEQLIKYGLEDYYVDSEYNRNGNLLKTIFDNYNLEIINDTCDLILHSRGEIIKNDNLICVEMKKSTASKLEKENDKKRIKLLTKTSFDNVWSANGKALPEHVCGYKLGVYYEVNVRKRTVYIEYYIHGKLFDKKDIYIDLIN